MANFVGRTMLSGALAAILAGSACAQSLALLPAFSGEAAYVDGYNEMLGRMMPEGLATNMFPMVQTVAVDVPFTPRLTDLDAYNATLAVLAAEISPPEDALSAYALVPGYRVLRVWEGPISLDK
jgi:hypothetical protein